MTKKPTRFHIHKNVWPVTDHGYTWVESGWLEDEDGHGTTPVCPIAGCCERLGDLPGGPLPGLGAFYESYPEARDLPILNTEEVHEGRWKVGTVTISRR